MRRQCLQIAAAEVNVLLPLHKAMTERLMAKVNRITSCRLTQFKGRTVRTIFSIFLVFEQIEVLSIISILSNWVNGWM